jgi:serine/threonine protein phosphatase 1
MVGTRKRSAELPSAPHGHRAYAVGDVHGRLDLLEELLRQIEADLAQREPRKNLLVFLGDLVDRGPDSRGVIELLSTYRHPEIRPCFLTGNHEEVLLRIIAGETGFISDWLKFGGADCLASYGVRASDLRDADEASTLALIRQAIPESHIRFIAGFADTLSFGDYLFVHAGVRPGIGLHRQSQHDLRWIRSAFLDDRSDHGFVVVHGHTISDEVEHRQNRIGIDTGAYRTGVLTALGLEGTCNWTLATAGGMNHLAAST